MSNPQNPLKIVLKFPKLNKTEARPADPIAKPHKKRKRREHESGQGIGPSSTSHRQQQPQAARDQAEASKKGKFVAPVEQPAARERSSNDAPAPGPAPRLKFVIKGFGKPRPQAPGQAQPGAGQSRPSAPPGARPDEKPPSISVKHEPGVAGLPDQDPTRVHKEKKKKHKDKKKHREKDRAGHGGVHTTGQLPQIKEEARPDVKLQFQPPAKVQQGGLRSLSVKPPDVNADVSEAIKSEGVQAPSGRPPAKPSAPKAMPAASNAPSTATGISDDITGEVGMLAGSSAPLQPPGALGGQAATSKPDLQPQLGDVERVLNRIQKKDLINIFRDPVTDAVAPGYSAVVSRPMSFTQMFERLAAGEYTSWAPVQADFETMFNNAMVYNAPDTIYHRKARELMAISRKLLETVRTTGLVDLRGRKPGAPKPASVVAAEKKAEANAQRVTAKAEKKTAKAKKFAKRVAASGIRIPPGLEEGWLADGKGAGQYARDNNLAARPLTAEENSRAKFMPLVGDALVRQWKGLGQGVNAEGVAFASGRPVLKPLHTGALQTEAYVRSVKAFGANLKGRAQELLLQRMAKAIEPLPPSSQMPPASYPTVPQASTSLAAIPPIVTAPGPSVKLQPGTTPGHQAAPSSVALSTVAAGYPMQSRSLQQQPQTQAVAGMPNASATQRPGSAPSASHSHASSQAPGQRWDTLLQPPASSLAGMQQQRPASGGSASAWDGRSFPLPGVAQLQSQPVRQPATQHWGLPHNATTSSGINGTRGPASIRPSIPQSGQVYRGIPAGSQNSAQLLPGSSAGSQAPTQVLPGFPAAHQPGFGHPGSLSSQQPGAAASSLEQTQQKLAQYVAPGVGQPYGGSSAAPARLGVQGGTAYANGQAANSSLAQGYTGGSSLGF